MGTTYSYMISPFYDGVFKIKNVEDIRVTDVERTSVDSINLLSKVGGIEELINIINNG